MLVVLKASQRVFGMVVLMASLRAA